jgi:small subunit ribosomal protein S5
MAYRCRLLGHIGWRARTALGGGGGDRAGERAHQVCCCSSSSSSTRRRRPPLWEPPAPARPSRARWPIGSQTNPPNTASTGANPAPGRGSAGPRERDPSLNFCPSLPPLTPAAAAPYLSPSPHPPTTTDAPAADEAADEAGPKAKASGKDTDGPAFSLSDAKRGNEWQPSDVDAALRYYSSALGGGSASVEAPPREADFVVNRLGIEDAAFFDDVDNNGAGTVQDAYAHAGVAEAAPKARPRGPRRGDEEASAAPAEDGGAGGGPSDELRDLEADKAAAAVFDELDLGAGADYEDMDGADAPWTWGAAAAGQQQQQGQGGGGQTRRGAAQAAAAIASFAATGSSAGPASDVEGIVASLGALDLSEAGVDPEAQELAALVTDDVAADADLLFAADGGADADDGLAGLPADAPALSAAEAAAVDAAISASVPRAAGAAELADAPTYALDAQQRAELEATALPSSAVDAYLQQLQAAAPAPADGVASALAGKTAEAPQPAPAVPAAVASARAPAADAQAMGPAPAELLAADPALEAALDADATASAAAAAIGADADIASVVAELAELAAVPAVEYSAAMFPEAGDMAVFEQLVNATAEYMDAVGSAGAVAGAAARDLDGAMLGDGVNPYDDLPEDLVSPTQLAQGALDDDEDAGMVDGERVTWSERVLEVSRVTKVVKGGKIMGFRAVVVVGDGKGRLGVGCQSGREVGTAVKRALVDAKRSVVRVPIVGAHKTLPHKVEAWFKGAGVVVVPAGPGTGVIAGGAVRSVLEVAGVQNCLAKRLGSRSNLNNARCTVEALGQMRTLKDVAELRGVPLARLLQ